MESSAPKNILANPIVLTLAIILLGALIVIIPVKMLTRQHSYHDLLREMKSASFGNPYVSAMELAKIITADKIPSEEKSAVAKELEQIYRQSSQKRIKALITAMAGVLGEATGLPLIYQGLQSGDNDLQFHAVVALGRMKKGLAIDWNQLIPFLQSSDPLLRQGAVLSLATHRVPQGEKPILSLLSSTESNLRYSVALGLINYKNPQALPTIEEILFSPNPPLNPDTHRAFKLNILQLLEKNNWRKATFLIEKLRDKEKDLTVLAQIRRILNQWEVKKI